jgi:hypothetical protein
MTRALIAAGACLALLVMAGDRAPLHASGPEPRLVVGDPLPPLEGDFLTGRAAVLPGAAGGKVAVLALGFSYESRFPVEAWMKRFREAYPARDRVTFFEVPMLGGGARLGRWFIDRGMRKGTARELHENVITVYGGTGPWKQRLAVRDDTVAYLVLIDGSGRVRWLHSGVFDEAGFSELAAQVDGLLSLPTTP